MKELSIEEKAKRYDELLLKLQKAKVDDNVCDEMYYRVIDDIVPELRESEDEKVRGVLIGYFKRYKEEECGIKTFYGIPADDILAWLEKQGEQVSAIRWYDASFIPQEMKELLVEWNSSDATWHDVAFYHANTKTFLNYERELKNVTRWCYVEDLYWEQSNVKETGISQHDEKTCVEWSEEDKVILDEIIDFFENGTVKLQHDLSLYASWLKSLKDRHDWKPSDEQIEALNYVVNLMASSGSIRENYYCIVFKDLREQLKRLK